MSLTNVRPYFRDRFDALGYAEWKDGFAVDNIPEQILDGSYHIAANSIVSREITQNSIQLESQVTTVLMFLGYRYPSEALDKAYEKLDAIYLEVMAPTNRLTTANGLRNVLLIDTNLEPLNLDNDNGILVTIRWKCHVEVCLV